MTRGQAEYLDYLRSCEEKGEQQQYFICWNCQHPLTAAHEPCPQCGGTETYKEAQ